jgi:hypothetical protein
MMDVLRTQIRNELENTRMATYVQYQYSMSSFKIINQILGKLEASEV